MKENNELEDIADKLNRLSVQCDGDALDMCKYCIDMAHLEVIRLMCRGKILEKSDASGP